MKKQTMFSRPEIALLLQIISFVVVMLSVWYSLKQDLALTTQKLDILDTEIANHLKDYDKVRSDVITLDTMHNIRFDGIK